MSHRLLDTKSRLVSRLVFIDKLFAVPGILGFVVPLFFEDTKLCIYS